jgi:exonuclease SbcC
VDIQGKLVWLEYTCKQDEEVDTDFFYNALLREGALEGSRVTLNILPTETVRAEEIAEAQRLRDKLKVWAESSGDELGDSILEKADELEEEAARAGQSGDGAYIRIDRLDLRGAIGIWKGTGLDTVSIDFGTYDPGLIALIGANGTGKTSLIESMHPWPSMLTREGKLQDQFRLRDSYRDLYFTDERSGEQYRALMHIDGQNKSGSVDYYLYRWDGADWQPLPGINGRKDPYIEEIEKLYGSMLLFLKSTFISQRPTKGNPDLSDATKGERKALFRELAGLDYLQVHADRAKELAREKEAEINNNSGRLEALEDQVAKLPEIRERVANGEKSIADIDSQISDIEKAHQKATADHQAAQKRLQETQEVERRLEALASEYESLSGEKYTLQQNRASYEQALDKRESAQSAIEEYEELTNERNELSKQYQQHLEERNRLTNEWHQERDRIRAQRDEYQEQINQNRREKSELDSEETKLSLEISSLQQELEQPASETCPTCGQPWPEEKKQQWLAQREEKRRQMEEKIREHEELREQIATYAQSIQIDTEHLETLQEPPKPELPDWDNSRIDQIDAELEWYDIDAERETLRLADQAETKIEGIDESIRTIDSRMAEINSEHVELRKKQDPEAEQAEREARQVAEKLQSELSELKEKRSAWNAKLEELREQVSDLERKSEDVEKIRQSLQTTRREKGEWEYLQRACGPDGIQALELDALAPSIAAVANRLLQAAYDSRFRLEFRTTRIGGSGSKTKQMETFEVYIHDTEAGTEQELKTLSGGEGVWIKKAIYDAFGIIRAQNTGTQFLTAFQDEADGALDPDSRERFFRMLERAHEESGRRHTIVITHSREIQEMISQRIEMDALTEAKEAVAV